MVLEGVEGAGKSTQARMLGEWMEASGIPFTLTREPGGTEVGEAIRNVVQDRPELSIPAETEFLLYLAARAAFVKAVALPVLERGELLIADRFPCRPMPIKDTGGDSTSTRFAGWTDSPPADWRPIFIWCSICR